MNNPKYQVFKSTKNSQFYFRLNAANGETILGSEGYTSKQGCLNGIESVKIHSPYDRNYDRKDSYQNYTFNLKSNNGEIIGRSENYTTSASRENGIVAVKRDGPHSPIEDLT